MTENTYRILADGSLEITGDNILVGGSEFQRLTEENPKSIEYMAGDGAFSDLGYNLGERVKFRLIIEPRPEPKAK